MDNKLKTILLDMMAWFHSFCVENDLHYYILGGTMLGAIRHNGFIPWDDDVDVGMPRKDYLHLRNLLIPETHQYYHLETPSSHTNDYYYCFYKLYDTRTTLIENTRYKTKRGVYLDIFPLDGMGNTEIESKLHFAKVDMQFKFILARTIGIRAGRNRIKNFAAVVSQKIPSDLIDDKKLIYNVNKLCMSRDFDNYSYGGNPFGAWRYKEIMPRAIMGKPVLYRFEDIEVYGAEHPEEYLTHLYGDWKVLPPEERRVTHHDFIMVDLTKPYVEQNTDA